MSDLLFAATAANDVDGVRAISQARRQDAEAARDALQNDSSTFTTVDDLEVAASAATAPTWLTAPLPPMPQRHAPDDACQMEASSEDEDACGSAWSGSEMMGEDIPSAAEDVQVKVSIDCKEITPMHPVRLTLHLYPSAEEKKEKDEEVDVVMQEDTTDEAVDMSSAGWAIYPIEIGCIEACETGEVTEEVHLEEGDSLAIVGTVRNRLGQQIVVEADPLVRPLDTGSVTESLNMVMDQGTMHSGRCCLHGRVIWSVKWQISSALSSIRTTWFISANRRAISQPEHVSIAQSVLPSPLICPPRSLLCSAVVAVSHCFCV